MKKMTLAVCFTSGLFLLTACQNAPKKSDQNSVKAMSDQMMQPADTNQYYYAIGSGMDAEKAKNDALAQIASKISIKVQSNLNTNLTVTKTNDVENVASTFSKDVQTQTKAIEFSGVKVLETRQLSKVETQSLVSVDRARLFQTYQNKLNQQEAELLSTYQLNQQQTLFEKLKGERSIQKQMVDTQSTLSLVQTINPNYTVAPHQQKYQNINNTFKKQHTQAVFHITQDKNSNKLSALVKDQLSDEGFKLSTNPEAANIHLKMNTKAEQKQYKSTDARVANLKVALRRTTFEVKQGSQIVSSNMVKTKGVANDTYENAIQETKAYKKLIQEQGIIGFLAGGK